ncbi:hypothetical protein FIBSPDRAFT_1046104 [Athelia psychrophila]|uniref:Uncharacterized protein n=1 Tax=Athelia psychrophila TaxID=1759441 RepID=A0A166H8U6_9AGAM|nr:hypothetical protein FIBSPDRAFT_1046104 [Fibularhizoctonia sp. CBS 109695]
MKPERSPRAGCINFKSLRHTRSLPPIPVTSPPYSPSPRSSPPRSTLRSHPLRTHRQISSPALRTRILC